MSTGDHLFMAYQDGVHLRVPEGLLLQELGAPMLHCILTEIQRAFEEGGIDGADSALDQLNEILKRQDSKYRLGPGVVIETDSSGATTAIGVPYCHANSTDILSVYWIMTMS